QSAAEKGKVFNPQVVRRLWGYLQPYKLRALWAFLLVIVYAGMQILGPYLLKVALDNYVVQTQDLFGLTVVSSCFLLTLVLSFAAQSNQSYVMAYVAQNVLAK